MVTVGIVAILAALAYPSYRNYVIRAQLVDATNGLSTMRADMERFFQDNRTYATANGFPSPCLAPVVVGNFTISCPVAPLPPPAAQGFTLQAAGNGPLTGFNFFVNEVPLQWSSAAAPAPAAWINNCPTTWMSKAGSC